MKNRKRSFFSFFFSRNFFLWALEIHHSKTRLHLSKLKSCITGAILIDFCKAFQTVNYLYIIYVKSLRFFLLFFSHSRNAEMWSPVTVTRAPLDSSHRFDDLKHNLDTAVKDSWRDLTWDKMPPMSFLCLVSVAVVVVFFFFFFFFLRKWWGVKPVK